MVRPRPSRPRWQGTGKRSGTTQAVRGARVISNRVDTPTAFGRGSAASITPICISRSVAGLENDLRSGPHEYLYNGYQTGAVRQDSSRLIATDLRRLVRRRGSLLVLERAMLLEYFWRVGVPYAEALCWLRRFGLAVAYTSDVDKTPATGSSFTYTSFAVNGINPLIIVCIGMASTTATVSSVAVSAGLTASTPVEVKTVRDSDAYTSIWAIPAPSGTGTITVTLSASVPWQSHAILLANADQRIPCPTEDAVTATDPGGIFSSLSLTPTNLTNEDASVGFASLTVAGEPSGFLPNQTFLNTTTSVNSTGGYRLGFGSVTSNYISVNGFKAMVAVRVIGAYLSTRVGPVRRARRAGWSVSSPGSFF